MSDPHEKRIIDMIARKMQADFTTRTYTTSTMIPMPSSTKKELMMPGQFDTFNNNDLPDDLRKLMEKQEEEIERKLAIPKELYEKQYEQDQLDSFRRALELERERQERNDPVKRELRDLRNEVEHLKDAMRRIGVLLDTDLPDQKAFDEFKMLREAFKKYKMVEKLVLGEDDK
jgi:hypothetical protein